MTLFKIPQAPLGKHDYAKPSSAVVTGLSELALAKDSARRKKLALKLADVLHSITFAHYECVAINDKNEAIDVKQTIAVSKFAPLEEQCRCHCGAIFGAVRIENFIFTVLS